MSRNRSADAGPLGVVPAGLAQPAAVGVAVAVAAYLSVFASITDVVGGTARTLAAALVAGAVGAALARVVGDRTAVRLTAVLFAVGLLGYYFAIPASQRSLFSVPNVALDVVSLLTGLSVLRLALADVWALALAPVPTFLAGYLTARGRHVAAATVAGGTLGFFVLTGDAGSTATLAGVVGVAAAVGISTLSVPGGIRSHGDTLGVILAVMILASATVTLVPAGAAQPWGTSQNAPGLESTVVADEEIEIVGSTRLSPEVRFTMESPVERNWQTGAYDTYTGDGWVRTGESSSLEGTLSGPPGDAVTVETTFTARTEMETVPAPWQAVAVDGLVNGTAQVDELGTIRAGAPILEGDRVAVRSRVIDPDPAELRNASTDYDPDFEERYTQLPESTPDRVGERTDEIVAGADNPYDQAVAIERYLIENYDYSLTVARPEGDIADGFLFEMDAGYCMYFATTMVAMLRTQGVPAQLVTGYTSGEEVSDDEYVVRGQDAHAWVKVYFPEHGWVEFDPTPSAERDLARQTSLAEARADDAEGVDTEESDPDTPGDVQPDTADSSDSSDSSDTEPGDSTDDESASSPDSGPTTGADPAEVLNPGRQTGPTDTGDDELPLPSGQTVGYWLFVIVVATAGARHAGVTDRVYHAARIRAPRRSGTPRADAERAFEDLERLLGRRHRERRAGETPRAYLDALRAYDVDERVHAVGETYERATYAGDVSREDADAARRTVRRLALESTPVLGRLFAR